jgi:hypothetical protein
VSGLGFVVIELAIYTLAGMVVTRIAMLLYDMTALDAFPVGLFWPFALAAGLAFYAARGLWRLVDYPFSALAVRRTARLTAEREVEEWLRT